MCHDTDQHQKHTPELTIHTTPPLHNDVNLSQPPKTHISDPTRDNAAKGRHRRNKHGKKNDNAPIVEGPIPPPELLEQATSGGYATTGSDSNGTSGDDTKITEAENQDQNALTDGTQTALWALGNQLENLGLSSVPPFQQMLEVTQTVKPLTQQFLEELLLIDLGFEPPQAPAGGLWISLQIWGLVRVQRARHLREIRGGKPRAHRHCGNREHRCPGCSQHPQCRPPAHHPCGQVGRNSQGRQDVGLGDRELHGSHQCHRAQRQPVQQNYVRACSN